MKGLVCEFLLYSGYTNMTKNPPWIVIQQVAIHFKISRQNTCIAYVSQTDVHNYFDNIIPSERVG